MGYAFCSWARVMIGYDVIYISDVARPGDQIQSGDQRLPLGRGAGRPSADRGPGNRPGRPCFSGGPIDLLGPGPDVGVELHF